jgi:hypothetical protein
MIIPKEDFLEFIDDFWTKSNNGDSREAYGILFKKNYMRIFSTKTLYAIIEGYDSKNALVSFQSIIHDYTKPNKTTAEVIYYFDAVHDLNRSMYNCYFSKIKLISDSSIEAENKLSYIESLS